VKYVLTCIAGIVLGAAGYETSERLRWTRLEQRLLVWTITVIATAITSGVLWP